MRPIQANVYGRHVPLLKTNATIFSTLNSNTVLNTTL